MERVHNAFHDYIEAPLILTKPNGDRVGEQRVTEKSQTRKFVEYDELTFTTHRQMDHKENPYYDDVMEQMHIEIPKIGEYVIAQLDVNADDDYNEHKSCTALSSEVLLAQKYLEVFTINMGTTESLDGIQLYSPEDTSHSLLNLVLEKCPDWSIGHVSTGLREVQRSFEVSREDVYSFLTGEMSEAFEAIVLFDTLNHTINVYKEDEIGEDINVALSYNNLLQSTDISSSTDDIKTCLTVTGDNDLNLREVNLGYDRIYNINYFHDLAYMSQGLYDAFTTWKAVWEQAKIDYEPLILQRHELVKQKNYQVSEKLPDEPVDPEEGLTNEDWTQYSLNGLKEKKAANEQAQAVSMKAGYGDPGDPNGSAEEKRKNQMYREQYLPVYNRIQAIDAEITVRQGEVDAVQAQIDAVDAQMNAIVQRASIPNNFTEEQYKELAKFIREDELSSSNYIVTDTMTEDERHEMLLDMLHFGEEELAKVSQPTLEFSVDMANIYLIPEFDGLSDKFEPGNYLYVYLRDDYYVKARIQSIEEDMINPENFKATFGNLMKTKVGKQLQDVTKALKLSTSVATTVSFGQSYWNEANKEATEISQRLEQGLLAAGETQKTASSDVEMDDRGIWVNNTDDDTGIFIGGGQILFTDDRFKTIQTALGKCTYTDAQGVQHTDFGLLAQFVIAGYIAGSTIEGTTIKGGTITGTTLTGDTINGGTITGTKINNGNGTFSVDENGKLQASDVDVTGEINATSGKIAEYTISGAQQIGNNVGLSGKSGQGWAFWAGSNTPGSAPFRVGHDGKLYATNADVTGTITSGSGTIGGWTINTNSFSKVGTRTIGKYTEADITAAREAQLGISDYATAQAKYDVTGNGVLDTHDIVYMRRSIAGFQDTITTTVQQIPEDNYPIQITGNGAIQGTTKISSGAVISNTGVFDGGLYQGTPNNIDNLIYLFSSNGALSPAKNGTLDLFDGRSLQFHSGLLTSYIFPSQTLHDATASSGYIRFPKFNMQIAWKEVTWTGAIDAPWGSGYDTGAYQIQLGSWAAKFSEAPRTFYSATAESGSAGVQVQHYGNSTATTVGPVYLCRMSSMTSQTWHVRAQAIGAYS